PFCAHGAYTAGGARRGLRAGDEQLAVLAWDAGEPVAVDKGRASGRFEATAGGVAQLALVSVTVGPVPCPSRDEVAERLDATTAAWRRWIGSHTYEGPWREAVVRRLLALKLRVSTDTGAIVAGPTTSLPERIGGGRRW